MRELRGVDQIVCAGDIVGYGPNPNECISLVREKEILTVAGNHDKAVVGEMSIEWFKENARRAIEWTSEQLTSDNAKYLSSQPIILEFTDFQIVHGSLRVPMEEYITSLKEAAPTLELMKKPLLFIGHSHRPLCAVKKAEGYEGWMLTGDQKIGTSDYQKILINPGAIGQPRDGDPRASFGMFDSEKKEFTLHRVEYNIQAVQEKMMIAGLPQPLIDRLLFGR